MNALIYGSSGRADLSAPTLQAIDALAPLGSKERAKRYAVALGIHNLGHAGALWIGYQDAHAGDRYPKMLYTKPRSAAYARACLTGYRLGCDELEIRVCHYCGCTNEFACVPSFAGGASCSWESANRCSACVP